MLRRRICRSFHYSESLNRPRKIDELDRIKVYMRDYAQLAKHIKELNHTIDQEKALSFVPFKPLHFGKKKQTMHVQLGQTVLIEEAGFPELAQISSISCPNDWYMINVYVHVWGYVRTKILQRHRKVFKWCSKSSRSIVIDSGQPLAPRASDTRLEAFFCLAMLASSIHDGYMPNGEGKKQRRSP